MLSTTREIVFLIGGIYLLSWGLIGLISGKARLYFWKMKIWAFIFPSVAKGKTALYFSIARILIGTFLVLYMILF
tara:strand:- start:353 stop:577 length:225 start_codon:yes stop_codon:yes gene_type:complete